MILRGGALALAGGHGPRRLRNPADDREVLDVDPKSFTTVWVDPDNASRYGTSVYERCGKRA